MSKTNAFETDMLELFFNATTLADLAENDTTAPATDLYVSLHTADPGEAGDQTTSEATYVNYARVAVARTSGGWTVAGNNVSNAAIVTWPTSGGTNNTITHFGIGTQASGAGYLMYSGAVTPNKLIESGDTPEAAIGDLDVTED